MTRVFDISIIIPHYKEKEDILEYNLSMIQNQVGVNLSRIEVLIVNDGPDAYELSKDFLDGFKSLYIKQYRTPSNVGPAGARNYALKRALGEYVMFSDCDDGFATTAALYNFFTMTKNHKPDMIVSPFLYEQMMDNGETVIKTQENKGTWIHGKIFKKSKLKDLGLYFDESIRYNEDTYYNIILKTNKLERVCLPYSWYMTRLANKDSMCKSLDKDNDQVLTSQYVLAVSKAIEFMRNHPDMYDDNVIQETFYNTLVFSYILLKVGYYSNISAILDYFIKYFTDNFDIFNTLTDEFKSKEFPDNVTNYLESSINNILHTMPILKDETYITMETFIKDELKKRVA